MDIKDIKVLEGLWFSVRNAGTRKRKGLTIHADELPRLDEVLGKALDALVPLNTPRPLGEILGPTEQFTSTT